MNCGCKRKARDLRRGLVSRLRAVFGEGAVQPGRMDDPTAPDVVAPHVVLACLCAARTDARLALKEARGRRRYPDEWAVAVCKDDGERPYVVLPLEDFIDVLGTWHAARRVKGGTSAASQKPLAGRLLASRPLREASSNVGAKLATSAT